MSKGYVIADVEMARRLIISDAYVMQEKIDGERLTITIDNQGIRGFNKRGEQAALSPWLFEQMKHLPERPWKFDGEYCGSSYVIFDLMQTPRAGLSEKPFVERIQMLDMMIEAWGIHKIQAVRTWTEPREKLKGYMQVAVENGEGLVFRPKDANAHYEGQIYKHKFRNSVDAVVLGKTEGKGSVEVGVYDGDDMHSLGKVTGDAEVGSVVEVSYRRLSASRKMIEPVFVRVRQDKFPFSCTMEQLEQGKHLQDAALIDRQAAKIASELRMTPDELALITESL